MILYVTSFNKPFYESTGRNLINTFIKTKTHGSLFVAYEDNCDIVDNPKVIKYNLDNDVNLQNWLKNNQNYIPEQFGGSAPPCNCTQQDIDESDCYRCHKIGCAHSIWNHRASGWAKKTFAMKAAIEQCDPDYLIWVDSDSIFLRKIMTVFIESIFKQRSVFYHYGPIRKDRVKAAETGLMGFKKSAFFIIDNVYNKYISQEYLLEPRWDDSHLYTQQFENNKSICTDLVENQKRWKSKTTHVVHLGPFAGLIRHDKGHHHRSKLI